MSEKYKAENFENEAFVNECLEDFDDNVKKIESEYAVTSKSA